MLSKKHQVLSFLLKLGKIIFLLSVVLLLIVFAAKIWQYGPVLAQKFNYAFNNSLLKPVSKEDSLTKLNVMLSQANLVVVSLQKNVDNSATASLSGKIQATFSLSKDLSNQVATLQVILARFRIEGRKVNRIDLRYNNVVVN